MKLTNLQGCDTEASIKGGKVDALQLAGAGLAFALSNKTKNFRPQAPSRPTLRVRLPWEP